MTKTLTRSIQTAERVTRGNQLRAVDYLRVSTDEQAKGYGIAYTGKATKAHMRAKGWKHVGTFSDEGESGTLPWQERPDAARLMRMARQTPRPFDVVVVNETRAIARSDRAFFPWVWELKDDLNIFVAVVDEDIDNTTEEGEARMREKANESFKELARIRKRTQSGIQEKAIEGGHPGGVAPYGWKIKHQGKTGKSRLVLDKKVGHKRLHEAWHLIVEEGMAPFEVEDEFNRLGHKGPTKDYWPRGSLRHILTGTAVQKAVRIHRNPKGLKTKLDHEGQPINGDTVEVPIPPMFSKPQLRRLNAALDNWARKTPHADAAVVVHPLSKRFFGPCGRPYTGVSRVGRDSSRAYRCTGKVPADRRTPKCNCSQVDADGMDAMVWSGICELLEDPDRMSRMTQDWIGQAESGRVDYEARIADLTAALERHDDAIAAAVLVAAREKGAAKGIAKAVEALQEDRRKTEKRLEEVKVWRAQEEDAAQRGRDLQELAELARHNLRSMSPRQQKEVLALLDVRVTIKGEIKRKVREGDGISQWFEERGRVVPLLTDKAWDRLEPILAARRGRKPDNPRALVDALLQKARTGCAWRSLPVNPASVWLRWKDNGLWEQLMDAMADMPGEPAARGVQLPPVRVEGLIDPRLFFETHLAPGEDAAFKASRSGAIRFQMQLAA